MKETAQLGETNIYKRKRKPDPLRELATAKPNPLRELATTKPNSLREMATTKPNPLRELAQLEEINSYIRELGSVGRLRQSRGK
jgi:hypothetical protein